MENSVFEKARKWICFNARPIDRARFRYLFENGSRESVLSALAEYQNEDGGFGHALEADCFNPNSSPIQTWAATEILYEVGLEEDHPIVRGILSYLDSGRDFNGKCWLNTVPSNNDYPRAPWWTYDSRTYDAVNYNPAAALAGFAMKFADRDSSLYRKCYDIAKEAICYLKDTDKCDEMHVLACYVRLAECCRKAGLAEELGIDELERILAERIRKVMTWDRESWKTGYVCKPSNFLTTRSRERYLMIAQAMNDAIEVVEQLTAFAHEIGRLKDEIIETLHSLSATAEENSASTEQMASSMQEQTATIEEISKSSESLSELAQRLQSIVKRFKVQDR